MREILTYISILKDKNIFLKLAANKTQIRVVGNTKLFSSEDKNFLLKNKQSIIEFISKNTHSHSSNSINKIIPVREDDSYAISDAQRRLWVLSQFEGGSIAYNMPGSIPLDGSYDIDSFTKALYAVIERHEILRTVFREGQDGTVRQVIIPTEQLGFSIDYQDYRSAEHPHKQAEEYIASDSYVAFDLIEGPLLRAALLQTSNTEYRFYFNMHHIISDGWSMRVLAKEVLICYDGYVQGQEPILPPLSIQYKDYAAWQIEQLETDRFQQHRDYWMDSLQGEIPLLDLPSYSQRPVSKTNKGNRLRTYLEAGQTKNIKNYIQQEGGTLFIFLLTSLKTLIYKYTQEDDIVIGSPIAGRSHADLESQIGFYVNTLAIRSNLDVEHGFTQNYQRIKENVLKAYDHQMYPFDRLVEDLNLRRDTSRSALFDIMMVLQNNADHDTSVDVPFEKTQTIEDLGHTVSKFDIEFSFQEQGNTIVLDVTYNRDIYQKQVIVPILEHYKILIQSMMDHDTMALKDIDILSDEQRYELLETFNDTKTDYPKDKTIVALFEDQAIKSPNNLALVFEQERLTYQELNELSNQLAYYLKENYAPAPDELIAIQLERSQWMIIAILATLKTGAAYLPIDPQYPKERIDYMLEDSQPRALINQGLLDTFITQKDKFSKANPINKATQDHLAYVIYTSGSTGKPKGVMVENQSLINLCFWHQEEYVLDHSTRSVLYSSVGFDASVWEIFPYLCFGGCLFPISNDDTRLDLSNLSSFFTKNKITHCYLPPKIVRELKTSVLPKGLKILTGGEALTTRRVQDCELYNNYGPTENTIVTTNYRVFQNDEQPLHIGSPISNTQVYILDRYHNLLPLGVAGEICISGDGLARGYLNRADLTSEKFIPHPFIEGERLYKTGDLGRWLPDGNIEFLGRNDDQVKIRGYRIELGEVESAILELEGIVQCVVLAKEGKDNNKDLVAYYTSEDSLDIDTIRQNLSKRLPSYMVPYYFIELEELPLTPNGKIDKKALPDPQAEGVLGDREYVAPRNETEQQLVNIWQEVLGREKIGIKDDFFELGGHSLKMMRLVSSYHKEFHTKVDLGDLFTHTSLESHVTLLADSTQDAYYSIPLIPISEDDSYAISDAQRRLWVLSQFEGGSIAYNMPGSIPLDGSYDIDSFTKALYAVIERHEILRTVFREGQDGTVRQVIIPTEQLGFSIDYQDYRSAEHPHKQAEEYIASDSYVAFDLIEGPLLRAALLQTSNTEYRFYFNMHHIISDGWSMRVLAKEVLICYDGYVQGQEPILPPLSIQYKDYAAWQIEQLETDRFQQHRDYWMDSLQGEIPLLDLPSYSQRPVSKTNKGNRLRTYLEAGQTKNIKNYIQQEGGTLFIFLLTSLKTLIYKYTQEDDIVIGSPIAGRSHADLESQIGFYVNTLAIRSNLDVEHGFTQNYQRIKENVLKAYDHQMYPFDRLVEDLNLRRDTSRSALFDIMMVLQNNADHDTSVDVPFEKTQTIEDLGHTVSKFDIEFSFQEQGNTIVLDVTYNRDIYQKQVIVPILEHYKILIQSMMDHDTMALKDIDILSDEQRYELLETFNDTKTDYPKDKTIVALFEDQAIKSPNNLALVFEQERLTYQELNELSNQLAYYLKENYAPAPDELIAIQLERSQWMIIAILATLKTGAAYLPIDPQYPKERIDYMLEDSQPRALINQGLLDTFITQKDKFSKANPINKATQDHLAYVIYTSGSTGKPKGVMISHANLLNYIYWSNNYYFKDSKDGNWGLMTPMSFDLSVTSVFTSLTRGKKLTLCKTTDSINKLLQECFTNPEIDTLKLTPVHVIILKDLEILNTNIKTVICGGEQLKYTHIATLKNISKDIEVYNEYGPTETTVGSIVTEVKIEDDKISIGSPISNTQIYILDRYHNLLPKGVVGEIYISGDGLARGYLNRPDLTNQKFIPHPFIEGQKLYKTGDVGRWLLDGNIEFLGRNDDQVKIRGYRIELGEIESAILALEGIIQCVVVAKEGKDKNKNLVAYYTNEETFDQDTIRRDLFKNLPSYMIPHYFINLEALPLTPNGKIDKKVLPDPQTEGFLGGTEYVAPRNEMERRLVSIWEEVLGRNNIGVYDNFYDLGGDSIKSIQVVSRLKQKGLQLLVEDVLRTPVINDLAQKITQASRVIDQREVTGKTPLTPIQEEFFQETLLPNKNHYNQSVLLESEDPVSIEILHKSLQKITQHHDALRMVYNHVDGTWVQENQGIENTNLYDLELHDFTNAMESKDEEIAKLSENLQASIDIKKGPLFKVAVFKQQQKNFILIVVHHLVVDGVSWRILLEDLNTLYKGFSENKTPSLPLKTDSFVHWSNVLMEYAKSDALNEEYSYWQKMIANHSDLFEVPESIDLPEGKQQEVSFVLDTETTELLQTKCHRVYNTEINDILLTALSLGISNTFQKEKVLIDLEGHGREQIVEGVDITRTVGWFTSLYPVLLDISKSEGNVLDALIQTKENLRKIPNKGIGYGVLKYLGKRFEKPAHTSILFNYLGDFGFTAGSQNKADGVLFNYSDKYKGRSVSEENDTLGTKLNISGMLVMGQLRISISYNDRIFKKQTIELLVKNYQAALDQIIQKLSKQKKTFLTPSDLTYKNISIEKVFQLNKDNNLQDIYRLSPLQEGLYYHWFSSYDKATYLGQKSVRLSFENLVIENVEKSYQKLIQRHDILRTEFSVKYATEIVQIVRKNVESNFKYIDLTTQALSQKEIQKYIDDYKEEDRQIGFQLNGKSQIRLSVINLSNDTYEFIWSNHHILMDGWCISILVNEFFQILLNLNNNRSITLPEATPYVNYINWLERVDKNRSLKYWEEYLKGYNQKAIIPFKLKTKTSSNYKPAQEKIEFKDHDLHEIRNFVRANKTTENILIQSIWGYLLSKYNNTNDVVFGTVVSGRPPQIKGVEGMVGLFINTIPVRVNCPEECTIAELIQMQQVNSIQSIEHHYVGLSEVQAQTELGPNLMDHILVFENYAVQENQQIEESKHVKVIQGDNFEQSHYDFSLQVNPSQNKMTIVFNYNQNMYDRKQVHEITQYFRKTLETFITDSSTKLEDINILSDKQYYELLHTFNNTLSDYEKDKTLLDLFKFQVEKAPDDIALVFKGETLTYKELDECSNQLARYLRNRGIKEGSLVTICLDRSLEMIVGLLGIMKSGGAYVPIDPEYPLHRIEYMLKDSGSSFLITTLDSCSFSQADLDIDFIYLDQDFEEINSVSTDVLDVQVTPSDLAYVIYTSGSTGAPKGAMLEQQSVVNRLLWAQDYYQLDSQDHVLQKTSFSFDVSVWEIFWTLISGARLVLAAPGGQKDSLYLRDLIERERITTIHFVPSMLEVFLHDIRKGDCSSLQRVLCSGEELKKNQVFLFRDKLGALELYNLYGPTEAAVDVTYWRVPTQTTDLQIIPIGKPIFNTQMYVLDRDMHMTPIGVTGELYIGGDNLARGYLNRADLTSEKFIPHPFIEGERLYKTGDLGRWLPDGNIEFLGRNDDQVKIRGYRIELGEVESAILELEGIVQCVVLAKEGKDNNKDLVAYYTSEDSLDIDTIRQNLSKRLPSYMVPYYFIELEELPLTPNGKIDKKALPDPQAEGVLGDREYVAPRNETEQQLVNIWQEVLGREKIGIKDDFFELGGHSLKAIQLVSKAKIALNIQITLAQIYSNTTIQDLIKGVKSDEKIIKFNTYSKSKKNIFLIPPIYGTSVVYKGLVEELKSTWNCYGVEYDRTNKAGVLWGSIEEMSHKMFENIHNVQSEGEFTILGYSMGANIAYEIGSLLEQTGQKVNLIILDRPYATEPVNTKRTTSSIEENVDKELLKEIPMEAREQAMLFYDQMKEMLTKHQPEKKLEGGIISFEVPRKHQKGIMKKWGDLTKRPVEVFPLEGSHYTILNFSKNIDKIRTILERI